MEVVVVVVVVVVVLTVGSSHSGAEEYPREKTQTKGGRRIYYSGRNSCLRQKHTQSEIGSQPTM